MDTTITKPDKKSLQYLAIIIVIAIIICVGYFYYLSKTEVKAPGESVKKNNIKEVLKSLGTLSPGEEGREIPEKILKSLGSPNKEGREVSEEVLKSLGTPN